ncbi:MAG: FMN reductase [Micrococcus sp.]|nr:FMN reductase [Micrococcus sp.]
MTTTPDGGGSVRVASSAPGVRDPFTPPSRRLVVVSGGLSDPSSTRKLADRLTEATERALGEAGVVTQVEVIELRHLATDLAQSMVSPAQSPRLSAALGQTAGADGIIAVSPTFKASYSGVFKSFWDLVDDDALRGVPVLLGATGGTARHSLMLDTAMRPLFAYLRAQTLPAAVFAAADDWGEVAHGSESTRTTALSARIEAAGEDLAAALTPRPRSDRGPAASATPSPRTTTLEVTPFEQLLARTLT